MGISVAAAHLARCASQIALKVLHCRRFQVVGLCVSSAETFSRLLFFRGALVELSKRRKVKFVVGSGRNGKPAALNVVATGAGVKGVCAARAYSSRRCIVPYVSSDTAWRYVP